MKGKILRIVKPLFTYPCDSDIFKAWQVKKTVKTRTRSLISVDVKLVRFTTLTDREEKNYVISLQH